MKYIKKLYDWVLHWAETPYGPIALFLLSFAEASFFPIPPDPLLIALILGARSKAFKFAANCAIASVFGAILGFAIGYFAWWTPAGEFTFLAKFFFSNIPGFTEDRFFLVKGLYDQWNFWIVFTAGFTPLPYKVFTVSGGAFGINFFMFLLASLISRSARFFLVAGLIWKYGEQIKGFIDKYFNSLAIAFTVLLIGGFLLIKYLL
jgi:membrane protein YqaA with SNARE-associated domain